MVVAQALLPKQLTVFLGDRFLIDVGLHEEWYCRFALLLIVLARLTASPLPLIVGVLEHVSVVTIHQTLLFCGGVAQTQSLALADKTHCVGAAFRHRRLCHF